MTQAKWLQMWYTPDQGKKHAVSEHREHDIDLED